jgi:hypothetical protein
VTPCSLAGSYQHFEHTYCLHHQDRRDFHYSTLKMEAAGSFKIMVTLYHTTWPHVPKNSNCHIHCHETHKSHTKFGTLQNWCFGQLHDVHRSDPIPCTVSYILWIKKRQDSYPHARTGYDTLMYCSLSYKHFQCIAGPIIVPVRLYM